jgi:hypothetical protein
VPSTRSTLRASVAGLVALAIALVFAGLLGSSAISDYHDREIRDRLHKGIGMLESIAQRALLDPQNASKELGDLDRIGALTGLRMTVIQPDGTVLVDSDVPAMPNVGDRPEIRQADVQGYGTAERRSAVTGKETIYLDKRIDAKDGRKLGHVRTAIELERVAAAQDRLGAQLLGGLLAAFALGSMALVILTQRGLKSAAHGLRTPPAPSSVAGATLAATAAARAPLPRVTAPEHERAA